MENYFNIVVQETNRVEEFANAHSYDDYITVYSGYKKSVRHDVCTLLKHRSGCSWNAIPANGSTIHIIFNNK